MKNYYQILELAEDADPEQIKKSFRRLAKKYHPDTSKEENAEERFKEINEAYSVLSNPDEREKYHRQQNPPPNPFPGSNPVMEQFFKFHKQAQAETVLPPMHIHMFLTLEEFHTGVTKHIKIHRKESCTKCAGTGSKTKSTSVCSVCQGSGLISDGQQTAFGFAVNMSPCYACSGTGQVINDPCPFCNGEKYETKEHEFDVHVGIGQRPDQTILLHEGHVQNSKTKRAGPVIIHLRAKPHPVYEGIIQNNLILKHELDVYDALLGTKIEVNTIDGKRISVTIPPRKDFVSQLCVEKQGISIDATTRGNLLIYLTTRFPELTDEEKSELSEIRKKYHG